MGGGPVVGASGRCQWPVGDGEALDAGHRNAGSAAGLYSGRVGREAARVTGPIEVDEAAIGRALEAARSVRVAAHAPYSRFRVGAAVLDAEGRLHSGCNVESASFGLTLCAERNALSTRVADLGRGGGAGLEDPVVVVAIRTDAETPTAPCGACRQWLAEFAPRAVVVAEAADGSTATWAVDELLPNAFRGDQLGG